MSSIWTPDGERPVGSDQGPRPGQAGTQPHTTSAPSGSSGEPTQEEMAAHMDELRQQLAETPAAVVVANHCFGLFELAALHLSNKPPKLSEAQLAIDALAALLENLTGRLGEPEDQLREALGQLRLAFVQIRQGAATQGEDAN